MKKALNIVTYLLCGIFAIILLINCILIVQSAIDEDKVPDVLGYFPMVVLSDSMTPTLESGDLIIYKKISPENASVGDIIVFYDPQDSSHQTLVTHRIIEIVTSGSETSFRTKGDANNTEDSSLVPQSEMIGIYKNRIPNMGNAVLFLQTTKGMLICIVIPLCLLFALDSFSRGRTPKEKTVEEKVETVKEDVIKEQECQIPEGDDASEKV
jgi:signal peptidase